jgi:protocatechuate 3,4-dioxygenase beta subunit
MEWYSQENSKPQDSRTAMRNLVLTLLLIGWAFPYASSQDSPASQSKGSIQGTVVDGKTGQPLRGAEVSLRPLTAGGRGEGNSSVADPEGHFVFEGLSAGRYRLTATRNGYVGRDPRSAGASRTNVVSLTSGQAVEGIVLRLLPAAVIAGRVTSEGDEPVPNVFVQAMKYTYQGDKRQLSDAGTSTTNDRGEYRIWGLAPGKYYIRATHPRGGSVRPGGQVYVPVFYPGVSDPSRTQAIELHAGDEITGIDLGFVSLRSVRVSGKVLNASSLPAKDVQVSLIGGSGSMSFPVGQAATDSKGSFEIGGVPPGSYTLVAEHYGSAEPEKVTRGRSSLDVGEVNLTDVELVIGPGASVNGRVRVEGKPALDLSKLSVALDAQDDLSSLDFAPDVSNVPLRPDGVFTFHDVPEGTYRIKILPLPDGYYLKSGGEADVVEAGVKIAHNHSATAELTLSAGAGRVTGTVSKDQQAFAGATVVLVPDGARRSQPRFYRQVATDSGGRFAISSVTPGDYKLFAWEEIERAMYLDPDFLQSYEDSGKPVHLDENSSIDMPVDLIPASSSLP